MASCERCWTLAGGNAEYYSYLIKTNNCTPEEQAGPDAKECPKCKRKTMHQLCGICMVCDVVPKEEQPHE